MLLMSSFHQHFTEDKLCSVHQHFIDDTLCSKYLPQALGYTVIFVISLKLNIFPFSASILTFSTQNHLILTYYTHVDTTHFFYNKRDSIICHNPSFTIENFWNKILEKTQVNMIKML
jgi:hypothetical protein